MLQYHPWIFAEWDSCVNADLSGAHHNNQLLYGEWLHQLNRGRTWYGLHYDWPGGGGDHQPPEGFDTYVISWHLENWDNDWLDQFCQNHPTQSVVVIGELEEVPKHPNLKILIHHCWHLVIPYLLDMFDNNYEFKNDRKYILSSLCNKPSQLKTLMSAYLLKNYYPRHDLLLSWNATKPYKCPSMDYMDNLKERPAIKPLIEYYQSSMINKSIAIDSFESTIPIELCNYNHEAFANSLINVTNETFAQSQRHSRVFPGPYFSEKTWKPLFAGTGVVPVGQHNTYRYLEKFGFCTDYPWPCEFDSIVGDISRVEKILDTIDWIFSDRIMDFKKDIMAVNRHNYEHIRSDRFVSNIIEKNQQHLELFLKDY